MAKTFLGQPVIVGDEVVYLKNLRTGSSTIRKCKCIGEVLGIKRDVVTIHCMEQERCPYPENEHKVDSSDIICILGETPYWNRRCADADQTKAQC